MNDIPKIQVEDFDAIFGTQDEEDSLIFHYEQEYDKTKFPVMEIALEEMHAFKNHPFKVLDDKNMDELMDSIQNLGILHPGLVRKDPKGGYEIISGHRRHRACQKLGLHTMPVRVLDLSDSDATICMTEANFQQREHMLISEKAKAYRMQKEAMHYKRNGGRTLNKIGDFDQKSGRTIHRLIQLANLTDNLMDYVDQKKLAIVPAVAISSLDQASQNMVYEKLVEGKIRLTTEQANTIKRIYNEHALDEYTLEEILNQEKKRTVRKICLKESFLKKYFSEEETEKEILQTLVQAMELLKGGE